MLYLRVKNKNCIKNLFPFKVYQDFLAYVENST